MFDRVAMTEPMRKLRFSGESEIRDFLTAKLPMSVGEDLDSFASMIAYLGAEVWEIGNKGHAIITLLNDRAEGQQLFIEGLEGRGLLTVSFWGSIVCLARMHDCKTVWCHTRLATLSRVLVRQFGFEKSEEYHQHYFRRV